MADLLEALMILFFGLSWPISIYRSYVSKTAKGKSIFFEVFLWVGYIFGIARKLIQYFGASGKGLDFLFYLGLIFYFLNIIEITIDMVLYFRNSKLDREREGAVLIYEEEEISSD